jgi:hypothetical protein
MFTQSKIAVLALTASLAFASTTQAAEVSLEQLVSSLMSQAISATQQELQYGAQKAVLTASNAFSMNEEQETFVAKVTITDLKNEEADKKQAE